MSKNACNLRFNVVSGARDQCNVEELFDRNDTTKPKIIVSGAGDIWYRGSVVFSGTEKQCKQYIRENS